MMSQPTIDANCCDRVTLGSKVNRVASLSDGDIVHYIYMINFSVLCPLISLFGIITNSLNITIFLRQGFRETINISLLGLSISDLCSLLTLLWVSSCYNPMFADSEFPILIIDLQHILRGWTHAIFTRITGYIIVFITFERFVCVWWPLKVKAILPPNRVKLAISAIYFINMASMSQLYTTFRHDWKHVEVFNTTTSGNVLYKFDFHNRREVAHSYMYLQVFYLMTTFVAVVLFTSLLVSKFNQICKWRQRVMSAAMTRTTSIGDRHIVRMVVTMAVIFIASLLPSFIFFIAMLVFPGTEIDEKTENIFLLSYSVSFTFEGINSSVNIFVYYKTSLKFKKQLKSFLPQKPIVKSQV